MTLSTANHLWSLHDVLGQGATASVYKARNKRSGELVAVKVFNSVSYNRPHEVQMREFEMLRKLNHKNIVRLHAVEELPSKQKVLVMEFCSGGSLLSLLEEPENAFGLSEAEFLTMLQCVVQGMNHLRENGVVHRDIKPGNIMRQVGEDGAAVYKLTDFGAARELEDDEKFLSVYGTEEYLHPDMYDCAVLRNPLRKSYGVSVDLWSIGVTFYHAAAGALPFTPFGGPRRNQKTMHKITTEKPTGAIAGAQRAENGPIEWSYQLPPGCRLSPGLRLLLVPILAGLLEADQERSWSFEQFFSATSDIMQRQPVHLFAPQLAAAHCVYVHHYSTLSVFSEDLASQSGVAVPQQHLLYLGHQLLLEESMKVVNLPPTSPERPLILLSGAPQEPGGPPIREPELPPIPPKFDVVVDYSFTKAVLGAAHQYARLLRTLHSHRQLILDGFYCLMMKVRSECGEATHHISKISIRLQACLGMESRLHSLKSHAPQDGVSDNAQKLQLVSQHLPVCAAHIHEFQKRLEGLQIEHSKLAENLASERSCQRMEFLLQKISSTHQHYRKDRLSGKLAYNDEQIHKFEKFHLSSDIKRVKSLFRDESLQRYRDLVGVARSWSSLLLEVQSKLRDFSSFSAGLLLDLEVNSQQQSKMLDGLLAAAAGGGGGGRGGALLQQQMVSRMHFLREEMEAVVQELQSNNSIIESLGPAKAGASLERPATL